MTQTNLEQGHEESGFEDGLAGGPGAPMPLAQLTVCLLTAYIYICADRFEGPGRTHCTRYPAGHRWGISYS